MDALLDGLPETLGGLLEHPERHTPAVVERLLERIEALRRQEPERTLALAEAAQRLAAKIPAFFPRAERFRLRARSFEVWGSLQRDLGDDVAAEAAYLAAFELMTQVEDAAPPDLAGLLGRQALLAGDRGDNFGVLRYVEAALEAAGESGRDEPLAAMTPLFEAVMAERGSVLPVMWVTLGLVANKNASPEAGGAETIGYLSTDARLGEAGFEIAIRRQVSATVGVPWRVSAHIRLRNQERCDIFLRRETPAADPRQGWLPVEVRGWRLWAPQVGEAAASRVEEILDPDFP